ncbi:MAG TPA: flagellar basal body-associated FliL family protein [Terriglobales bacterium]|nr:flagellar basal body-associated FliL family protein [Terriglobales bacterium]
MRRVRHAVCIVHDMPPGTEASFAAAATASKSAAEKPPRAKATAQTAGSTDQGTSGDSGGKSRIWIYLVVALVAAAGIVIWLAFAGDAAKTNAGVQSTLPLDTFVVNLDGAGQRAYLRVGITLGLTRPPARNGKEEMPVAPIRDAILSVLASAQAEKLLTTEGKEELKANLLHALNERVPQLGVQSVYFTEFLVQM